MEWWYPVHALGGFTFANRDLAANVALTNGQLRLRLLATGVWKDAQVRATRENNLVGSLRCNLSPVKPADVSFAVPAVSGPFEVLVWKGRETLASFRFPLDLPVRRPPEKKPAPQTAAEVAQAGWNEFLFARFSEAESQFRKALEKDPKCVEALNGLAYLCAPRDREASPPGRPHGSGGEAARRARTLCPGRGQPKPRRRLGSLTGSGHGHPGPRSGRAPELPRGRSGWGHPRPVPARSVGR